MTQEKLNYMSEEKNLGEFWNPKEGKFQIEFLSELCPLYEKEFLDKKTGKSETQKKTNCRIKVNAKEYTLELTKAGTNTSFYGQVIRYANQCGGSLIGAKATIIIDNDGKKRSFTLVELNR